MKLAEISIKRPTMIIVLFTVLTLAGLLSYQALNYELLPKFSPPVLSITTIYPGASPSEVENTVTKTIEDAVASMENIKKLEATSFESVSVVVVTLKTGADVDYALNEAQRKVNAILNQLPDDTDPPSLNKFSLDDLPIMTLSATAEMDSKSFYDLMDKRISPQLSRIEGVAQVSLIGGREREIQVNLDAEKLQAYGLSILQVQQMIVSSNLDFPTGRVETRDQNELIRLSGKYRNVDELRNIVISQQGDVQIRLGDIADVQDSEKDVEKLARFNQQSSIVVQIIKQSDANAVAVSEDVQEVIHTLEDSYSAEGLKLAIANDSSTYTLESAEGVIHDLLLAVVLVAVVMLLFLHSIRNSFIVMVSIPASLIATFIGINMLGYTLNLMSLLGLSLVVGILVDDAIVVLENIYRHMEMGKNRVRAAYDGTKEIGFTVSAITLVIIAVFFPVALSSGLVSDILRQFCMTVIIATSLSLLASFTIVPWLSSRFGKLEHISGKNIGGKFILWFERRLTAFTHWMTGILEWSLKHRFLTLLAATVLFFSSFYLVAAGYVGADFFPKSDRGQFLVQIELPKDASIEQTNQMARETEAFLRTKPEVTNLITTVGQSSSGGFGGTQSPAYAAEITVGLVDKQDRADDSYVYAAKVKRELANLLVGAKVTTVPVSILGTAQNAPLSLTITGNTLESALDFAEKAEAQLKKIPGATEIQLSVEAGNPELKVEIDRDKMAALGLNLQTVGATMQTAFSGNTQGKYRAGEYEYDINIRYDDFNRKNIDDVSELIFVNNQGRQVELNQFATITETSGPSQLERRDKSTSVKIEAQTVGRPTGTVAAEWEAQFEQLDRPTGVDYVWGGDMENQSEGFGTLGVALLAAIVLVYLIMVALYNSFVYPFVVLFSIPLSFIGALLALGLTNNSLNIFTILGIIMLIGLVAKNAILLVDFANHRKEHGENTHDALVQANHARLRPILMTTIAMVFGMLPIAIASGAGAEWKNGLAWVIIGGLLSSLFLTLVIVPVVYSIMDSILRRFNRGKDDTPIDELMEEEYEPQPVSDDGFTPVHI
ncbi:MAG: efflux RND transporter permease subunit [Saprospiraceae bacterium]|nr:efflux RND transporter permease subunit [Lewinella sp.]